MNEIRESMTCLMSQRACSPPVIVTSRCHICTMAKNAVSCASVAKSVRSLTCNLKILFAWLIIFLASLSVVSYTFFNPLQVANKNRISPDRPLAVHRNLSALPTSREGVIVSRFSSDATAGIQLSTTTTSSAAAGSDRYVIFGKIFNDGRGLGNQLFNLASIIYVSELTGRQPAIVNLSYETGIERVFDLRLRKHDEDLCPCRNIYEGNALKYDRTVADYVFKVPHNETINLVGFFQSWKYTRSIESRLRRRLVFRREIQDVAERFLTDNVPPNWIKGFLRVGIHVRRGDILTPDKIKFGYTAPDEAYFQRAMTLLTDLYASRIQFIVVSNDMNWCREHFESIETKLSSNSSNSTAADGCSLNEPCINITYSVGLSGGQDFALLASCDHVIMSTGTYGWWAAWLAKGTTVYYADWPRNGSLLRTKFDRRDFFPPSWIGLT